TAWLVAVTERFIPPECRPHPEAFRRARLIAWFGVLGLFLGSLYALFYLVIGHLWGAGIVGFCGLFFAVTVVLMRWTGSIALAGNLQVVQMGLTFTSLCFVEGGLRGHAVAWLASVPLCALLVTGKRVARIWVVICLGIFTLLVAEELSGMKLPMTYDPAWHELISAMGYMGLIVFLFLLGMIFETGREQAFGRMEQAVRALETSNQRLKELNQEKTEFMGIAAHDLKNPLTSIIGNAELLKSPSRSERELKSIDRIVQAGIRMRDLIVDLLDANAIEEGKITFRTEPCDMAALVRAAVDSNASNAQSKSIAIRCGPVEELWAMGDRKSAQQILDNLISNALKFSPRDRSVYVFVRSGNAGVEIGVRDEGPGIGPEDQARMFQKFSRLSAQPTGNESSTGLGLSIVKKLAAMMSGRVECQSELGAGATFILWLPPCAKPAVTASSTPAAVPQR
ncbi:MAG TPA: HAMP domain-containing sensor histidine kinase, partial [Roseimicrobium sp.]|nr:HAMP domain-containing sensor histidine kinase [Roseimicrobium sp.]